MQSSEKETLDSLSKEELTKRYSDMCMRLGDAFVQREHATLAMKQYLENLQDVTKAVAALDDND